MLYHNVTLRHRKKNCSSCECFFSVFQLIDKSIETCFIMPSILTFQIDSSPSLISLYPSKFEGFASSWHEESKWRALAVGSRHAREACRAAPVSMTSWKRARCARVHATVLRLWLNVFYLKVASLGFLFTDMLAQ